MGSDQGGCQIGEEQKTAFLTKLQFSRVPKRQNSYKEYTWGFWLFIFWSFFFFIKPNFLSYNRKDSRTIAHSGLRKLFPLPQIFPPCLPDWLLGNACVVHGVLLFCEGNTFLIFFICRNIWQARDQSILVSNWGTSPRGFYEPTQSQILEKAAGWKVWVENPGWPALFWNRSQSLRLISYLMVCLSLLVNKTFQYIKVCHPRTSDSKETLLCTGP